MNLKELMRPVIVLCVICLLTTAALAGTNVLTKDIIEENSLQAEIESRQKVLPSAVDFQENGDYVEGIAADGSVAGYVFVTETKGYGGTIKVMTGIDAGGMVTGVSVLEHSETVGLGANAEKPDFVDQFKAAVPDSGFNVVKSWAGMRKQPR